MKLPFTLRDRDAQANFDRLTTLLGFNVLRKGTGSATWTAAQVSGAVTVSHGLGRTPTLVLVTFAAVGSGQHAFAEYGNVGASSFDVVGWSPAAFSASLGFSWLAAA